MECTDSNVSIDKTSKNKVSAVGAEKFQNKMFWSKLIIHQKALYDIFL